MRPFYRKVFVGFCATGVVAGGAIAFLQTRSKSSSGDAVVELSADDFNALQDKAMLRAALQANHLPWNFHKRSSEKKKPAEGGSAPMDPLSPAAANGPADMKLVYYRLLGCPYCAKVESVLRFHDIPYEEVHIDPISGGGLPDPRYRLAPQLYLTPLADSHGSSSSSSSADKENTNSNSNSNGVYIVDSAAIVTSLAGPLGYSRDLRDPRIAATRNWITARFQSASFVVTNSTVRNAYVAYGYLTPPQYQNLFYRVVGSFALYGLANYKIKPRVLSQPHPFEEEYRRIRNHGGGADGGTATAATTTTSAAAEPKQPPEAWLRDELAVFLARLEPTAAFHGGRTPDLADVEMFGVTRVVSDHPLLGKIVREGRFGEWERAMKEVINTRRDGRA